MFKLFDDIIQHAEEAWNGFRSYTFADDGVADGLGDIGQFLLKVLMLLLYQNLLFLVFQVINL